MEAAVTVKLFGRGIGKNLVYKVLISDGDISGYDGVCNMNSGEGPHEYVEVEKGYERARNKMQVDF